MPPGDGRGGEPGVPGVPGAVARVAARPRGRAAESQEHRGPEDGDPHLGGARHGARLGGTGPRGRRLGGAGDPVRAPPQHLDGRRRVLPERARLLRGPRDGDGGALRPRRAHPRNRPPGRGVRGDRLPADRPGAGGLLPPRARARGSGPRRPEPRGQGHRGAAEGDRPRSRAPEHSDHVRRRPRRSSARRSGRRSWTAACPCAPPPTRCGTAPPGRCACSSQPGWAGRRAP